MVQQMKIGYQGVQGSHSEDAALRLFSSQPSFKENIANLVGFQSFEGMLAELVNGNLDRVLVPLENSLAGTFFPVLDLVLQNDVSIIGEYEHEEFQVLAALPGSTLASISEIHSHPYAFDQCRPFIASQLHGKRLVQSIDTAGSCAEIAKNKLAQVGAIASERAAKMYNLQVLSEIASEASVTRYALISKTPIVPERHTNPKTSIHVILKNQVGALMKAVSAFAHRDIRYTLSFSCFLANFISISKIESRPSSRSIKLHKAWEYEIFLDLELGTNDPRMVKALENLEEFAAVKILGSFPKFQKSLEQTSFTYGV